MARRRLLAIDTSDGMANLVLGLLAVLIVASLALIPLLGSADEPSPAEPQDEVDEVVPAADADEDAAAPEVDLDAADPDVADPDANAVDPDVASVQPTAPDDIVIDPDGSGDDTDAVLDEPVDSLTVEGAAGTAAGLVGAAPVGGETADGGDTGVDPTGTDGTTEAATARVDPEVGGDAGEPTASDADQPGVATTPAPPSIAPDTTPSVDAAGPPDDDEVVIPPEPDGDRYQPDDPDRIPALTVPTSPRDRLARRVDLDGDGMPERVWSAVVADVVHTRVDELVGGRWRNGPVRRGPVADRLVDLRIADLTGDGRSEIWTWQWVATEGQSVTLWSYAGDELQRMDASGGCWNGSNTFGLMGALVQRATPGRPIQIAAICEDPALPWWQWPSALYRWEDGRWTADRLVGKYR